MQLTPVLGVVDGNTLFAVQNGSLKWYPWYNNSSSGGTRIQT